MKRYKAYTKEKGLVECDYIADIAELTWHRLDGPAITRYDANGNVNIVYDAYWINDIEYTKEDYYKELLKLKVQSL